MVSLGSSPFDTSGLSLAREFHGYLKPTHQVRFCEQHHLGGVERSSHAELSNQRALADLATVTGQCHQLAPAPEWFGGYLRAQEVR